MRGSLKSSSIGVRSSRSGGRFPAEVVTHSRARGHQANPVRLRGVVSRVYAFCSTRGYEGDLGGQETGFLSALPFGVPVSGKDYGALIVNPTTSTPHPLSTMKLASLLVLPVCLGLPSIVHDAASLVARTALSFPQKCNVSSVPIPLPSNQTTLTSVGTTEITTLGRGIQNYTCSSGLWVSTGALAK